MVCSIFPGICSEHEKIYYTLKSTRGRRKGIAKVEGEQDIYF